MTYAEYLQTEHWQTLRRLALEAAAERCLLCDRDAALDVHHRTYARVGAEQLRDLVVLCEDCHQRHHDVLPAATEAEHPEVRRLEAELAAEMAGAAFLAAQVERAWIDGIAEGQARAAGARRTTRPRKARHS